MANRFLCSQLCSRGKIGLPAARLQTAPAGSQMKKQIWIGLVVLALASSLAAFYGYEKWSARTSPTRGALLAMMPSDASAVFFVDFAELRAAPFIAQLLAWAPKPQADPDYAQFMKDTGFDYERDLDRIGIAIFKNERHPTFLAVAEGRFDKLKISTYALKNGRSAMLEQKPLFVIPFNDNSEALSLLIARDDQFIITNDTFALDKLHNVMHSDASRREWHPQFERLAGTSIFAVIRQDAAAGSALAAQTPGGLRSPQLSGLLDQLQWITIAGKPENDHLRIVMEGECSAEIITRQLADLLNGVLVLAEAGLNDAKTRQQLDPAVRAAYLELLGTADVSKIDRGDTKSVRLTFEITPAFLESAHSLTPASPSPAPSKPLPGNAASARKGHT